MLFKKFPQKSLSEYFGISEEEALELRASYDEDLRKLQDHYPDKDIEMCLGGVPLEEWAEGILREIAIISSKSITPAKVGATIMELNEDPNADINQSIIEKITGG